MRATYTLSDVIKAVTDMLRVARHGCLFNIAGKERAIMWESKTGFTTPSSLHSRQLILTHEFNMALKIEIAIA